MPRSKKPKPTFDVARAEVDQTRASWVYRSDPTPAVPDILAAGETDRSMEVHEPAPRSVALEASSRQAPPTRSPSSVSSSKAPGWIEAGVGVMVFPLTLAMVMLAAPVFWMVARRERTR